VFCETPKEHGVLLSLAAQRSNDYANGSRPSPRPSGMEGLGDHSQGRWRRAPQKDRGKHSQ